ncbi:MAG: phosphoribosyltransferase family protein [Candidatus Jordarchaeales archaeon]
MSRKPHMLDIQRRIEAVELLKLMKERYTYKELCEITGLPATVLNRYVKGHVLPSRSRAEELFSVFSRTINLKEEVMARIKFDEGGYFDNTALISDTLLLRLIAKRVAKVFADREVTAVLTAAVDGIPIAVHVANVLDARVAVAKREREIGVKKFLEESYTPSFSGIVMSLYLPQNALSSKDNVLIVDDVVRTGETQKALISLVEKARGKLVGAFFLIAIGNAWIKHVNLPSDCKLEVLVNLAEPKNE